MPQVNGFYPIQLARDLVSRSLAHHSRGPHAPLAFAKSLRRISRRCEGRGAAAASVVQRAADSLRKPAWQTGCEHVLGCCGVMSARLRCACCLALLPALPAPLGA